jgi:serine/threonine-protein kinase
VDDGKTIFQSVRPGTCLNDTYEIAKMIAQGGMGEVYRGFNIQTRDLVAIKMIRPELSNNREVLDLFRREASILHTLQHEAIVRYFGFSVDPQLRRAYLAMEFVDGPSLTDKLISGPLSLADVNILRSRIGSALSAAHARGVVHRDVSSDNIIFPNGDVESAKIIDFGIARALRPGEGTIIGDRFFVGKYNYASPEQLGLIGGDVTFKSDIYSFGLVLAEALRGRPIDMSGTQAEINEKRRAAPELSDIQPSIRPLIRWMLQPSPADRPASMAAVADWREPEGSGGGRDRASHSEAPQAERASRGGRLAPALGAIIAIVSIGGAAFVFRDDLPRLMRNSEDERGPQPPKNVDLPPATVDAPYRFELPAFEDPGGKGLRLSASSLPEGLTFTDLGQGKGLIQGEPKRAGTASVRIDATDHNDRTASIDTTIAIKENLDNKAKEFIARFDGGDCFLVKPVPQAGTAFAYLGIGPERETFDRFEKAFKQEVGIEPHLIRRLITRPQCPVLNLMRPGPDKAAAPRIELSAPSVDRNTLAGTITNLRGRRLYVILVDNDGGALRLDAKIQSGGDAGAFSQFLRPDPDSVGPTQLIFAIVSGKPIPVLDSLGRAWTPAKTIAPALVDAAKSGEASVGADFFVLVN